MVFSSHEVELIHILVGKNNERLTGTECAVNLQRWGREGVKGRRKRAKKSRKKRTQGDKWATHSMWCKEGGCWMKQKQPEPRVLFCHWKKKNRRSYHICMEKSSRTSDVWLLFGALFVFLIHTLSLKFQQKCANHSLELITEARRPIHLRGTL